MSAKTKSNGQLNGLIPEIESLIRKYPGLKCGVCVKSSWLEGPQGVININANTSFPAASLIKIPIAVALLQKIDKGQISWGSKLTVKQHHYSSGSGILKKEKTGTKVSLRKVFKLMLTISDNTATNMIIDLLGGISSTNQQIAALGLKNTKLVEYIGVFPGKNSTSPQDMVDIFESALEGNLLSNSSRRALKSKLLRVENNGLISKGIGRYTKFVHKTGTVGVCVGDAGIIYLPLWKRIAISIIVKRPFNSLNGQKIIREISRLVYENLN